MRRLILATRLTASLAVWAVIAPTAGFAQQQEPPALDATVLEDALARAGELDSLRTLIVARDGEVAVEETYGGGDLDRPTNVKSVAKSIIAALVGVAIDREILDGVDQRIATLLKNDLPDDADPRLDDITVGHLLTMQSGLERTSGPNYGRWVQSGNWVRHALSRPFEDEPGGAMIYSTGNTHLLSAILTRASGRSTHELAQDWLADPLGIAIPAWERDPQGIYLGGNNMALTPRALLRFGEMYRQGGRIDGQRVLSEDWVSASRRPQGRSRWTGHGYGYGWFVAEMGGHQVNYAWGYGGQMVYVIPALDMTIVMTSDADTPSGRTGYVRDLHALVRDGLMEAARIADAGERDTPAGG